MNYTLIDYFNGFVNLRGRKRFSAGVQATYFAILAEFNQQRFPDHIALSTRDLQSLAGLKSVSSAQEARNVLKNNKLVDFHTEHGITVYALGTEHLPNTYRTPTEHLPNANRTPKGHSLTQPVCLKEEREERKLPPAPARARGLDEVVSQWESHQFAPLNFVVVSKLEKLVAEHGASEVIAAMAEASLANKATGRYSAVSFNFFEEVMSRRKGAKANGGAAEPREHIAGGCDKPWRKRNNAGATVASESGNR